MKGFSSETLHGLTKYRARDEETLMWLFRWLDPFITDSF